MKRSFVQVHLILTSLVNKASLNTNSTCTAHEQLKNAYRSHGVVLSDNQKDTRVRCGVRKVKTQCAVMCQCDIFQSLKITNAKSGNKNLISQPRKSFFF